MRRNLPLVAMYAFALPVFADAPGERLFALHCAACHGQDARGSGAVGKSLDANPADLTRMAERNGGEFPTAEVVAKIDGRALLPAHGGEMPVYGWFFEGPKTVLSLSPRESVETTEDIAQIVMWLATLQR